MQYDFRNLWERGLLSRIRHLRIGNRTELRKRPLRKVAFSLMGATVALFVIGVGMCLLLPSAVAQKAMLTGDSKVVKKGIMTPVGESSYSIDSVAVNEGAKGPDALNIANTGRGLLDHNIEVKFTPLREIDGAYVEALDSYKAGMTMDIVFHAVNASSDAEWIDEIVLDFPAGCDIITSTDMEVIGSTLYLAYDFSTGDGATVAYLDWDGGYGNMYGSDEALATITIAFDGGLSGDISMPYTMSGDDWGNEPHDISGVLTIRERVIDFGVTPDDFGDPNACPTITPLDDQYVVTQSIVFGSAVDGSIFDPPMYIPPTEIRNDASCGPEYCRSNGVPAFRSPWWCQFMLASQPGVPDLYSQAGVNRFSAKICYIENQVSMIAYDFSGNIIDSDVSLPAGWDNGWLSYHDNSEQHFVWFVFEDIDYYNMRFTNDVACLLETLQIAFDAIGTSGTPGADFILFNSDGIYPTDTIAVYTVTQVTALYPSYESVDCSADNIAITGDYHLGYTPIYYDEQTDVLACMSDKGLSGTRRSSNFWGDWGLMINDWGQDVNFLMRVYVHCLTENNTQTLRVVDCRSSNRISHVQVVPTMEPAGFSVDYLEYDEPIHVEVIPGCDIIFYGTYCAYWFWTIPDPYGDDYFNMRFTHPEACTLKTLEIAFYAGGSVGAPGADFILFNSDGTYPTDMIAVYPVNPVTSWFPAHESVDCSADNIVITGDYHLGYSPIYNDPSDVLACLSDDGSAGTLRSGENWLGFWGLMFDDWGEDINFLMRVYSCCREEPSFVYCDADGSGVIDIDDAVYVIGYIFSGGPPPDPLLAGDCNCSYSVDIDDVVYLIGYIFSGGDEPCVPDLVVGSPDRRRPAQVKSGLKIMEK